MNAPIRHADIAPHRWTVDEVLAAVRAGAIKDDCRWELIDGELIDMPADGPRHRQWTGSLGRWLQRTLGDEYVVMPNTTLMLSSYAAPSPDWHVFPAELDETEVDGGNVLLVIEQADTSLRRDLSDKAALYARHGIRDYWVVDLEARRVHVHRQPTPDGYADTPPPFQADQAVEALLIPGLTLRLSDLTRVN